MSFEMMSESIGIGASLMDRLTGGDMRLQIGGQELAALPTAVLAFGVGAIHVLAFAVLARRLFAVRLSSMSAQWAYLGIGYAAFGLYIWLIGYADLLRPWWFLVSAAVGLAVVMRHGECRRRASELRRSVSGAIRAWPFLSAVLASVLAVAVVSGLRGIQFDDDYKWQSAVVWADAGSWVRTPYRLTNGTAMSEMFHVVGAAFGSTTAAHWLSTLAWVIAAMNGAALARLVGVSAPVAVAAMVSIPVFTSAASVMGSDVTSLMFALNAFVFLLAPLPTEDYRRPALAAGVAFAAVLSTKFIVLACLPVALIIAWRRAGVGHGLTTIAAVVVPLVIAGTLWAGHTYRLIGKPYDSSGKHMARTPDDPMWKTGEAAGRIPSLVDLLRLPVEPWVTTVWGQREPYGGRTGLLWALFIAPALWMRASAGRDRSAAIWLLVAAVSFFALLGPVVLKTRFLMFSFVVAALLASCAYERRQILRPRIARAFELVFLVTVCVGTADGARRLLQGVVLTPPPAEIAHVEPN